MGDCRIRIQYDAALEGASHLHGSKGREMKTLTDQLFASDSTVQELFMNVKLNQRPLFQLISESHVCLWDCTVYPPVDITNQLNITTTLFSAGWFPSARLQLLPHGIAPSNASSGAYDDEPDTILDAYKDIKFVSRSGQVLSGRDKPSELLQSATDAAVPEEDDVSARRMRSENRQKSAQKQKERLEKLQKEIQKLEQKSGKTSAQVRKMLIKSRATGRSNLIDRIHFKCYIAIDDEMTNTGEDYRFFSSQDTVGKIVESFAQNRGSRRGELLVATDLGAYLRLPTLMRLYEAKEAKYIEDFVTVVIRFYDTDSCIETPSINEANVTLREQGEGNAAQMEIVDVSPDEKEAPTSEPFSAKSFLVLPDLAKALAVLDSNKSKKGSSKPGSTTVDKVKQMQMKAKAKGDGKRVKLSNRFYFELVVAAKDCHIERTESVFLAQSDPLSRILRDHVGSAGSLLVLRDGDISSGPGFDMIDDTSTSLEEATRKGIVTAFGRIIAYLNM